jgi:phosphohistidine phosphatase
MRIILVRHGKAEDPFLHREDGLRALTEEGAAAVLRAAKGLVRLTGIPERWVVSPLLRARQTAELLIEGFAASRVQLEMRDELVPHAQPLAVLSTLAERPVEAAMVVGHEPCLGSLFGQLLTGNARAYVPLDTGMAAAVELDHPAALPGRLLFVLSVEAAANLTGGSTET